MKTLTTHPPLVRTNPFALDVVLGPTARRDKDGLPALGWDYDPVDWCWTGLAVGGTNEPVTLVLTNGVVVATYGDSGSGN